MKKALLLATASALVAPIAYADLIGPEALVTINGQSASWDGSTTRDGDRWSSNGRGGSGDISFNFSFGVDSDPEIIWAFAVTNTTAAPVAVSVTFLGLIADGIYGNATASFSGSLTDGSGDGVGATSVASTTEIPTGISIPGLSLGADCVEIGGVPAKSYTCPSSGGGFGPVVATVGPFAGPSTFTTSLSFALSAMDSASFNGAVALAPADVPEPSTFMLFAAALIGTGLLRRHRV